MDKIGLFVDVQNIYYTTRHTYARQFNYRALWEILQQQGDITVANAYATDRGDESQQKFQTALRHIGFNLSLIYNARTAPPKVTGTLGSPSTC